MRTMRPGLTFSILASLACLLILTWLLFSLLAFKTAENDLYSQKADHGRMLLATFVNQLPDELPRFPESMLPIDAPAAIYASKLAEERSFVRLSLLDSGGKIIYTAGREGSDLYQPLTLTGRQPEEGLLLPRDGILIRSAQVLRNGTVVGRAGLVLSLADEQQRIQRTRQLLVTYFILDFILLLGLGAFILSRIVVRPVNRLLVATEKITGGVYGHQLSVSGPRELADLAESFNAMSCTLAQKQQEVTSHVATLEQVNSDLQQAREETTRSEKMASVGLLAAGTAHEIGTPLASIMGYVEILTQELEQHPVQADYLRRIQDGCTRIDRIVKGLLEYARPKQVSAEPTDLVALVRSTVELLQHQGLLKNIKAALTVQQGLEPVILDPHQLQQVLINLLINAIDAMPHGGELQLAVRHDQASLSHLIAIRDSGAGIPAEHVGKLFDPFLPPRNQGAAPVSGWQFLPGLLRDLVAG